MARLPLLNNPRKTKKSLKLSDAMISPSFGACVAFQSLPRLGEEAKAMMNQSKYLKQLAYMIWVAMGFLFLLVVGHLAVKLFIHLGWID